MAGPGSAHDAQTLLEHTAWMRSLALSLVADEAQADDLVQETLLRAMERPPREAGAVRAWLRTVLRNVAFRAGVSERRRRLREARAARPEVLSTSPESLLERVELEHELVDHVLKLEEPFRSTVLLRFFEGLSPGEIAGRQGVDVTTVRWRLRRALARLRERLDRLHGDRKAWAAILLPGLGEPFSPPAGAAWTGGPGGGNVLPGALYWIVAGAAAMKNKTLALAFLFSLILLLGLLPFVILPGARRAPEVPARSLALRVDRSGPPAAAPAGPPAAQEAPPAAPPAAELPPRAPSVVGLVLDAETGEPLPGATVKARGGPGLTSTDAEGAYALQGLKEGEVYLVASAEGHAEQHAKVRLSAESEFRQDFALDTALELLVRVEDSSGQALEGVRVTPCQPARDYIFGEPYSRWTDAGGMARLTGINRVKPQQVNAWKAGYREVWTQDYRTDSGTDPAELLIVLEERAAGEHTVAGRVTDRAGAPLAGIRVQWIHPHGENSGKASTSTDGAGLYVLSFRCDKEWVAISASGEGWGPAAREHLHLPASGEQVRVDFALDPAARLEGEVVDEAGTPVEGARVKALPNMSLLRNTPVHPGLAREAVTDASGSFVLEGLSRPRVALRLEGPRGGEWAHNFHPQVEVEARVRLTIRRWGAIRGKVLDRETGEPVPVFNVRLKKGEGYYDYNRTDPGEFFNSPEGLFVLRKLDPEPHSFTVEAEGYLSSRVKGLVPEREESGPLHEVRISRGRPVLGVVLDAPSGAPLAGARVVFGAPEAGDLAWDEGALKGLADRQESSTGADGSFRFREGDPAAIYVLREGYGRVAVTPEERPRFADASGRLWIPLAPGRSCRGVLWEDGAPSRRGFLVLARERDGGAGGAARREWVGNLDRDDQGRFVAADLVPGRYLLEHWRETPGKRAAGLGIRRVLTVPAGEDLEVEFGKDLGPHVYQGRLLDAQGKPLEKCQLILRPEFEWHYTEFRASSDRAHQGLFWIGGLKAGRYGVEAALSGRRVTLPALDLEGDREEDLILE